MGFFSFLFGGKSPTDRYGNNRLIGRGPRVKSGPTKGLLRARTKTGNWEKKHKF